VFRTPKHGRFLGGVSGSGLGRVLMLMHVQFVLTARIAMPRMHELTAIQTQARRHSVRRWTTRVPVVLRGWQTDCVFL